ncbi:MAG: carbohydrate ABC transporter permease [Clostridiales bacterium]|nr:carbohydrate ABC transporter permease [Clostridiales bacterium]
MRKEKLTLSRVLFNIFNYSFFAIFTFACFYPMWYVFIYSISNPSKAAVTPVVLWPQGVSTYNFIRVMELEGVFDAFIMSVLRTVIGTVLAVFSCLLLGYLFTKEQMPFRKFMYRMLIVTMYISGGLIPTYLVYRAYGLLNNFLIYVFPCVSAYYVILIKTYIESIPPSLEESAVIDGAGPLTVFWKIITPLAIPIAATIAIYSAVDQWNAWFDNHIYTFNEPKLMTLSYLLYIYLSKAEALAKQLETTRDQSLMNIAAMLTPKGVRMTITMVTVIPILLVYPFMQKYFIKGIMLGAVKG